VSEPPLTPNPWRFVVAFTKDLTSGISGGLSVPFAAAGLYYQDMQRVLFLSLSAFCFVLACYNLWKIERLQLIKAHGESAVGDNLFPDWTIKELFMHVCPTALENDEAREAADRAIVDALAIGRLKAWGRTTQLMSSAKLGSLQLIKPEYWIRGRLTMWFLHINDEASSHARSNEIDGRDYFDIKVNRRQALSIWPAKN
jgi:hypothetical protein